MKTITLKKLSIRNYRNIQSLDLDFNGASAQIVGENHIGKTNTLEAIVFLLTDKLLNGSKDLPAIKPQADTKATVSVEATFEVTEDGGLAHEFTLRKEYKEQWVKARGTDEVTMQGHVETLFYNGVKQGTAKAYNAALREEFGLPDDPEGIELLRLLTLPGYLGEMGEGKDWTAFRSFVIKAVGDVNDSDVFQAHPELNGIAAPLAAMNGKTEMLKKKLKQDRDGIAFSITQLEAVVKSLEDTKKPTDDEVALAREGIAKHEATIAQLNSETTDVRSANITEKINAKRAELISLINSRKPSQAADANAGLRTQLADLTREVSKHYGEKSALTQSVSSLEYEIETIKTKLASVSEDVNKSLIAEIMAIDSKMANPEVEDVCPTCGQPLPAEKVQEAKDKAIAQLEAKKASLIEQCQKNKSDRVTLQNRYSQIASEIEERKAKIVAAETKIAEIEREISQIREKLSAPTEAPEAVSDPAEEALQKEIQSLEAELAQSKADWAMGRRDAAEAVMAEREAMKPFQAVLDDLAYFDRQMATLKAKRAELSDLRKKLAVAEQQESMLKQFIRIKLDMLDANVAKVFGNIRFKLVSENINGGYDPVCKAIVFDTVKNESTGVPWASASKSERVETGIAIAEALKKHLNLPDLPFLFDEGGEISTSTFAARFPTKSQIVCVRVIDDVMSPTVKPLN